MYKKRILWCGESSHLPTGFGNYTREILSRLYNTQKYEIAELSCYRSPKDKKIEPWKVYPVVPLLNDPFKKIYDSQPLCAFGQGRFDFALLDFKPDIVIDVRDFWYFNYQNISPLREYFHWMVAPTFDSIPQPQDAVRAHQCADSLLFHTNWAMMEAQNQNYYREQNILGVVNDAVDYNTFFPIRQTTQEQRLKFDLDKNMFIIGSVMRNQKRKLIPDLFHILKTLLINNQDVFLYLHTTYPEQEGWNIPSLLLEYNVQNNVLLTYHCKSCKTIVPSQYQGIKTKCRKCDSGMYLCGTSNHITQNQLNQIYNLFDIYLQYSICEGFGIPQVEAAASGLPVITIDHGAMKEIGTNIGADIIPISRTFKEMESGLDRVYPDNDHCIRLLDHHIKNRDKLKLKGLHTKNLAEKFYSWDKTTKDFEKILDEIVLKNNQGKWGCESQILKSGSIHIPNIDNNREFVYYILDHVLYQPDLKNTMFIEEMIMNLDNKIIANTQKTYSRDNAMALLQNIANNKLGLEKIRLSHTQIPDSLQSFINYQ